MNENWNRNPIKLLLINVIKKNLKTIRNLIQGLVIFTFIAVFAVSCEKKMSDIVHASYLETGCSDPWDIINNYPPGMKKEQRIALYLEKRGVKVLRLNIETVSLGPFCLACTCWTGRVIKVSAYESDVERLRELGFQILE
jgi:hypothetical protein